MILGVPVVDGHELTMSLVESLGRTSTLLNFRLVIIDNASEVPYDHRDYTGFGFQVDVIRNEENVGYYTPLIDLFRKYPDEQIGLIHNDMVLYESGWDSRMAAAFANDPRLGLVGLCGSNEIDERGGRGGGTMCFFRGADVQVGDRTIKAQSQDAGRRIVGINASCTLDSLFMMFNRQVIEQLHPEGYDWHDITLAHFYDRIWPLRVIEAGYRVATMGVECDHLGGMTTTANERYRADCIRWLEERSYIYDNPETEMYLIAERRYLSEYREQKKFIPCIVGPGYEITNYLA